MLLVFRNSKVHITGTRPWHTGNAAGFTWARSGFTSQELTEHVSVCMPKIRAVGLGVDCRITLCLSLMERHIYTYFKVHTTKLTCRSRMLLKSRKMPECSSYNASVQKQDPLKILPTEASDQKPIFCPLDS